MSFYNYGQNVTSGLGDFLDGGEHGFTFASGIKQMLQNRKLDAQKAADAHTQAGITAAVDLKGAGLERAPTPSPTTGGGPVSPLDDPTNQPRQDGAMEVGGTTPLATGIGNPTPTPSLLNRIGGFLQHPFGNGGQSHSDTGQNAGVHTTDAFTDTGYVDRPGEAGKMTAERINDASQSGENARGQANNAAAMERERYTQGHEDSRNLDNNLARIKEAQIRAEAERQTRGMMHADANTERRLNMLRQMLGNLNSVQHGFMGGLAQDPNSPEWKHTEAQKAAVRREMEQLMGMKPGQLEGFDGDMPGQTQGAPGQQQLYSPPGAGGHGGTGDIYEGFDPSLFGGPHGLPPATDPTYKAYLRSIGKGPR